MCGIVGQVRRDRAVDAAVIHRMCAAVSHRGPDSRGTFFDEGVGLGVQRLRVIDLVTGDQPMYNEDGTIVVVLNGEIYNFAELRHRLSRSGHTFRSKADTEVIVHLYEELGPGCVKELHGMFAFALWDRRSQLLMLARDRVGKKPLYYSKRDGALSFGSELQGLLQDHEISRELDHRGLDCYYAYQYIPAPLTAFKDVRKLPPATVLIFKDGTVRLDRYWRLRYTPKLDLDDRREMHERIRSAVDSAVRRRMLSDVPLGAFLSGGIDSSAVVAAMARQSSDPVKTFSIGFEQARFNELPYARLVAREFATDHHEFVVRPSAIDVLPTIVRHYGEPFADASAIPSFYLAALTRQHVTVALNGDGGDESFAGYNRYLINAAADRLGSLPIGLRRFMAAVANGVAPRADPQSLQMRIRRLGTSLSLTPTDRYARYMSYLDSDERDALYTAEYKELIGTSVAPAVINQPWEAASGKSIIDVMLEVDVETYLPGDLLVKMDIATMAHSVEARSPLLDHELMELAASIPPGLKVRRTRGKAILRDAYRGYLPEKLLDRPKMGFAVPLAEWFRHDLRDYAREVLLDPRTSERGYFKPSCIEGMLRRHFDGQEDNSSRIWSLIVAELWHRDFVDRDRGALALNARDSTTPSGQGAS
jgi:asparagine synthase (glutamine-hydrolysing)